MVNARLIWCLETNKLITEYQSGYRSPMDHLIRLETFIREASIKKEHLVAVFFDLEKAYDTTWKYGIVKDLKNLGLEGRMPIFIQNFLQDRRFRVRMGEVFFEEKQQEMGVPQGSVLSVTLFNIKINNIVKNINSGTNCALYVDDFLICYRARNMNHIERQLQICLDKLYKWTRENGLKFSKEKTKCIHFCNQHKLHLDPVLKIDHTEIPIVEHYKYLGNIFDRKLSFIPHIKYLRTKCNKTIQLLRTIAHTNWGGSKETLLKLYRSLIRSRLDYGCFIYGAARKTYLKELNTIHYQGLRLALGAYSTSIESLYTEPDEPPLRLRCEKLALQYSTKLESCPSNPAYDCTFNPKYKQHFERKEKTIKPFGLRMKSTLQESKIPLNNIHESIFPQTPPWIIKTPKAILELNEHSTFQEKFYNILQEHPDHLYVFMDGSKDNGRAACMAVLNKTVLKKSLPRESSIFTAEALALNIISKSKHKKFIIFSDSLSVLLSLRNKNSRTLLSNC